MSDWTRGTRFFVYGVASVTVLAIIGSLVFAFYAWSRAASEREETRDKLDALQVEYNSLYEEYRDATGTIPEAPTPTQVEKVVGERGATGATGDRGPAGEDGKTPTIQELNTLLAIYCASRGDNCVGQTGPQGAPGLPGAASTVPGPAGAQGEPGTPGRSVTAIVCENGTTLVFYDQYGAEISRVGNFCF